MSGTTAAQRYYGRWALLYDLVARSTPRVGGLRERTASLLALEPGDTVVDFGTGTGANLPYLRERVGPGGTVIGVDFTREVLDRARESVEREGWENVHLLRGDVTRPPLGIEPDAVCSSFVVGMLAEPGTEVDRWIDALAPGGRIALCNAARSRRWYGPLVNAPFRGLVLVSTPGPRRRGFERSATEKLDERIAEAHGTLAQRCDSVVEEDHAWGIVRISAGTI